MTEIKYYKIQTNTASTGCDYFYFVDCGNGKSFATKFSREDPSFKKGFCDRVNTKIGTKCYQGNGWNIKEACLKFLKLHGITLK